MRKILAILVLLSYMLCAFGTSFAFHHCGGKFKYVNVHSEKKKNCCKGETMPKDCCKTVKVTFKKTDDKAQSFLSFAPKVSESSKILVSLPFVPAIIKFRHQLAVVTNYCLRPPPLRTAGLPLYITHSVYRI